jgi:hypothetical protein
MKTKYILSALLAAGLATAAHASLSVAAPDLVLGFQESGASNDYEVNLGSMTTFLNAAAGAQINLSGDLSATDLSTLFGSTWANEGANPAVTWGAAATNGATGAPGITSPTKISWVTQADGTILSSDPTNLYTATSAPGSAHSQVAANPNGNLRYQDIGTMDVALNGAAASTNTANSNTAAVFNASTANSYSKWDGNSGNGWGATAIDSGTGLALTAGQFAVIDLYTYQIGSGSGSYLGSLELGTDGSLWFTAVAVPEPSTYAAILGVACLAFVAIRRRKQQILA